MRSIKEPKDKNHHHNVNNTVQMSTPEKAFKQAQDLLYAMAAKTPVCIIVLLIMVCLMVIKATFNNISGISRLSVLLLCLCRLYGIFFS